MRHYLAIVILVAFLSSGWSCYSELVTGPKQGIVFKVQGRSYGIYDQRYADLVASDGTVIGGAYDSVVSLGPVGRFAVSSTRPLVQESATCVLVALVILTAAFAVRGRKRVSI